MTDLFETMAEDAKAAALRAAPSDDDIDSVRRVGQELLELDARITKGQALLKDLVEQRERIMRQTLVDRMDTLGIDTLGFGEYGVDIRTGEYVHASLPAPSDKDTPEQREEKLALRRGGLDWLVAEGHDSLIKTVVTVELPRGAFADAQRIKRMIDELPEIDEEGNVLGNGAPAGYVASVEETVHWATLTSFVKEQLRRPEVVLPLEMLGATVGRIAKIVKRKSK